VPIGPVVLEICLWTDRHTDRRVDHDILQLYQGGVKIIINIKLVNCIKTAKAQNSHVVYYKYYHTTIIQSQRQHTELYVSLTIHLWLQNHRKTLQWYLAVNKFIFNACFKSIL